jgi:exonuclease III
VILSQKTVEHAGQTGVNNNNLIPIPAQKDSHQPTVNFLRVCSLNARSVRNKADEISEFIIDQELDILAITETWLSPGNKDNIVLGSLTPSGYQISHNPRKSGRGGGVAFIYKDTLTFKLQPSSTFASFEHIEALISTGNDSIRLVCIYRPPNGSRSAKPPSQFYNEFVDYIDSKATTSGHIVITGDFNFHFEDISNSETTKFKELLYTLNFDQCVQEPTHRQGHLLDLVLCRSPDVNYLFHDVQVLGAALSDHSPVLIQIPFHQPSSIKQTFTFQKINKIDSELFKLDIAQSDLCKSSSEDVSVLLGQYNQTLSNILEKHAPLVKKTVKMRPQAQWYTKEIRLAKQSRRRAESRWRKHKLSVYLEIYKDECKNVSSMCREAKKQFYCDKIKDCGHDQKELFKIAKGLMNSNKKTILPTHHDASDLSEAFAEYFTSKIEKIRQGFSNPANVDRVNVDRVNAALPNVATFDKFAPVTEPELKKFIMASNSKYCQLDPIPTSLLKSSIDVLIPTICKIVNCSLNTSAVPADFKSATVTPLIKKPSLDKEDFKNYRPISNLPYIAKLTEKVVVHQLNSYMTTNSLHEPYQSAYRSCHSTETAVLRVYNDTLVAIDDKKCVMLILLDLSAAFDTVEHSLLLQRLEKAFGITGDALTWLTSYFHNRYQSVQISGGCSKPRLLKTGMPQGSVFGPFGFPKYSSPIGVICRQHGIAYHLYADDTQLYIAFSPDDQADATRQLEACIDDIRQWMSTNFLKLNESKTEFLIISSPHDSKRLPKNSQVSVGEVPVSNTSSARNIGAIFDCHLNMVDHVNALCRACYLHIRNISRIRQYLTQDATERLIHAFISSKLDYLNSLLIGLPRYLINRLQRIQNIAARIVTRARKYDSITIVLESLHWLPMEYRIQYKIALLTFKALNELAPSYLSELITAYKPARSLRSSSNNLLEEPAVRTVRYGERSFFYCAPKLWNTLPNHLRLCTDLDVFKADLKTFLFRKAYLL